MNYTEMHWSDNRTMHAATPQSLLITKRRRHLPELKTQINCICLRSVHFWSRCLGGLYESSNIRMNIYRVHRSHGQCYLLCLSAVFNVAAHPCQLDWHCSPEPLNEVHLPLFYLLPSIPRLPITCVAYCPLFISCPNVASQGSQRTACPCQIQPVIQG